MYITELFGDKSALRYTYYSRGTTMPAPPNSTGEAVNVPWFDRDNGKLFRGEPIVFSAYPLLDGGIDLVLDLGGRYFIDHLTMKLVGGSALDGLDILCEGERLIARALPEKTNTGNPFTLSVGCFAETLTLRFSAAFSHFGIASIALFAAADLEEAVYPLPTAVSYGADILPFSAVTTVLCSDPMAEGAMHYLTERLSSELSHTVTTVTDGGAIRLLYAAREDDGYTLSIGSDGITVTAAYPRAFYYAVSALLQLATEGGFRYATINDTPMMEMRGVHLALPCRDRIPFLFRLVRELFVPMRYNMVFIQLSGAMQYKCFPEINEAWLTACRNYEAGEWPRPAHYGSVGHDILTHEEIREICAYIRAFGLEVIPEVQSFSHSQYITTAFPHLAELPPQKENAKIDQKVADIPPNAFYPRDLCPRHPEYYDYVLPILDEVIDVIRPERFVHMGHDEVYEIGSCPRCKGHATDVYVEEVTRLHAHLKEKGLSMMIWSDMLQEGEPYMVPGARGRLPRDIIMLDFTWYFEIPVDIEDRLLPHGYRVMVGNMYSSHYPRYETRIRKPGMIGAQVSTWTACNEESFAAKGKMFDFVYTANMMWNPTYDSAYRLTYTELVKALLPTMRRRIGCLPTEEATKPLEIGGSQDAVPNELLFHSPAKEAVRLSQKRRELTIPVGRQASMLDILHATDRTGPRPIWEAPTTIGEYVLAYEDGSEHVTKIRYGESILLYRHRYAEPIPSVYYRHSGYSGTYLSFPVTGKDSEGRDYTLLRFPLVNPYPEKRISRIVCRHAGNTDAEILIFDVKTT